MTAMEIRPVTRKIQRALVARWHSHHLPTIGETLAIGAYVDGDPVAVIVLGLPVAPALQNGVTWEVTRLAVGPDAPRYAASRLLGAASRAMDAIGIRRQISYTRIDERGTCYRAANWYPTAIVRGDGGSHGNRATWLPGLHMRSTEVCDRVRWERGPDAASAIVIPEIAREPMVATTPGPRRALPRSPRSSR